MTSPNDPINRKATSPEDLKEEPVSYWGRNKDGLFGIYQSFHEVARIETDYLWMPAYCETNFKVGTVADETIRPHDIKSMVQNQFGDLAAKVAGFIPFFLWEVILYVTAMLLWKSAAFRDSHHVFVDMLFLKKRYPGLFAMMADKEQQQNFYRRRQDEQLRAGTKVLSENLRWTTRFSPLDHGSLPFEVLTDVGKTGVETDVSTVCSSPSDADTCAAEDRAAAEAPPVIGTTASTSIPAQTCMTGTSYPVFVKPKCGAYGEDCHIRDLRQIVCSLKNKNPSEWTEKRVRYLLFEQLLQNGDGWCKSLKAAGMVASLAHPLVTVRIWTKRFVSTRAEDSWIAAVLVGPEDEEISNSKGNQCFVVDKEKFTICSGVQGKKELQRLSRGKQQQLVEVPYCAEMVETALWAHEQTPELPMLGHDFAICMLGPGGKWVSGTCWK
eukprot:g17650.t1